MNVTVIVPTYNRADFLTESLKSIANQKAKPFQVVVVDDASTDHTAEVVHEIQREFFPGMSWPFFRYVRLKENGGKSFAVNQGIADAEGDLVWIFDDDDVSDPDRLGLVVPFFEEDPELDVVHTSGEWRDTIAVQSDGHISQRGWTSRRFWQASDVPPPDRFRWFMTGCRWFGISVIWRRSILERLAKLEGVEAPSGSTWPFDVYLGRAQDYDFWIRLLWAGAKVRAVDVPTVYARDHKGRRGPGHCYGFDELDRPTAEAEKRIFEKILDRIPIETIWPDSDDRPSEAYLERAYAVFLRGLWSQAYEDLSMVDGYQEPEHLTEVHIEALNIMIDMTLRVDPEDSPGLKDPKLPEMIRKLCQEIRADWGEAEGVDPVLKRLASA